MTDRPDPVAANPDDVLPITAAQLNEIVGKYEKEILLGRQREARYSAIHASLAELLPSHIFDPLPSDPEKLDEYNREIVKAAVAGMHFHKILKAVHSDEAVKSQWDRLVMMIGLAE